MLTTFALTLALGALPVPPQAPAKKEEAAPAAPPGLVLVEGRRTRVGAKRNEVEALVVHNRGMASPLAGETPQYTVKVDDFYLMPTEVTNEQYARFVEATGSKPPRNWGREALDVARRAFLEEQGRLKREAAGRGERHESRTFDDDAWWEDHWRESTWAIPTELLDRPVVFVNYFDVLGYCRWAGLRLMTEEEYQCAGRGESEDPYPWGDSWDDKAYCSSFHYGEDQAQPVGSFPAETESGLHDLVGNVWEWTQSPYVKFQGYEPISVEIGRGRQKEAIAGLAGFDTTMRVAVGGSYKNERLACRLTTRRDSKRNQSTDALGFRCAASIRPGLDVAETVLKDDVRMNVLPADVEFYTPGAVAHQRWTTAPTAVDAITERVPQYRVIDGYDYAVFVPTLTVPATAIKNLRDHTTENGPVFLGYMTFSRPLLEPRLDPGTYFVAWRGEGKLPKFEEAAAPEGAAEGATPAPAPVADDGPVPFSEAPGFDEGKDCFLFYDLQGSALVAFAAAPMSYDRMVDGSVAYERFVMPKLDEDEEPPTPEDTLTFRHMVAGKTKSKGFRFELPLRVEPGVYDW